ncbi:hypothetical protein STH12_00992 [Shewanella khirikhana]|uniref:Uncharacterized protein n=2 Tax=Shewanella khirikhana TaxID=1965282 RepID=A0ABM7D151_9GAMM|nr:hypothetical protein STH12_00992 [Shewanella khirikhana]
METFMAIYLYLLAFSVSLYLGRFASRFIVNKWLVGWKVIVIKPSGDSRVWYFDKKD